MNSDDRLYGFRANLNDSLFDTTIPIMTSSGEQITKREFTIRTFLMIVFGIILLMIIETQTVIGHGGFGAVIFGVLWMWLVWEVSQPLPTKKIAISYFLVLARYLPKRNRQMSFRSFAPAYGVSLLTGIQENGVSDRGVIRFLNNDIGRVFEITGSASRLMFDEDRTRVVNDARNFYRNINPTTTMIIDTLSSPQRVKTQVMAADWQLKHMTLNSQGLKQLLEHEKDALEEHVGHQFPMFHQYFVIRAVNEDEMNMFIQWLMQVMGSSSLYLKDIRPLDSKTEVVGYLHQLFSADSEILNEGDKEAE